MPQRNNFHMFCKAQSSTVEWMVCVRAFMRWHFWEVCVCVCVFFDLLQDEMILIVFLSGFNLKLEKFHCSSPSSFSQHPLLPPSSSHYVT